MMQLRIITTTFLLMTALLSGIVFSASEEKKAGNFLTANNDVSDLNSLQRGARNFFNYCAACHSLKYIRYNQIAEDLDLQDSKLLEKLIFTGAKPEDFVLNTMLVAYGCRWL